MPRLLLVMPSTHPGMAVDGVDGVDVDVADEDVVVEEVIEGGIMTVMLKQREKEGKRQLRKARIPVRVQRGDGLSSQMADLTLGYVGMLLPRSFKPRRKPSWTMDLLLPRSRNKRRIVLKVSSSPLFSASIVSNKKKRRLN